MMKKMKMTVMRLMVVNENQRRKVSKLCCLWLAYVGRRSWGYQVYCCEHACRYDGFGSLIVHKIHFITLQTCCYSMWSIWHILC